MSVPDGFYIDFSLRVPDTMVVVQKFVFCEIMKILDAVIQSAKFGLCPDSVLHIQFPQSFWVSAFIELTSEVR